jgi:hypothetical protein
MRYYGVVGWKILRTGESGRVKVDMIQVVIVEGRDPINQCHQGYCSISPLFAISVRKNWSLARLVGLGSSWTRAESSAA